MKDGHYGIYHGKEYRVYFGADGTVDITSDDKSEIVNGFQPSHDGKFVKNVKRSDLESAFAVDPKAEYHGHRVGIDKEDGDKALIFTDGEYDDMKELGFNYVERGVYEKWVKKDELENLREEQTALKL